MYLFVNFETHNPKLLLLHLNQVYVVLSWSIVSAVMTRE